MATKAQIARKKYGASFDDLSPAEKAAVTRAFNAQTQASPAVEAAPRAALAASGYVTVKFGRPGVNGMKECIVAAGTTVEEAHTQSALGINKTKEGILDKATGATVKFSDTVRDGAVYMIVPGVDSSHF